MTNYVKPKNSIPKPEEININSSYAFTINPVVQYEEDPDRLRKVIRILQRILNSSFISYKLYIEVSKTGRIHGHGYIRIQDAREFYIQFIPYIIKRATVDITPIAEEETWSNYIIKQCAIMQCRPIYKDYGLITHEIRSQGNLDIYYQ